MKITTRVSLAGSEQFGLSHPLDCNCYLLDGGSALAIVDTGLGLGADEIIDNMAADGFDAARLTHILLTHAHPGHWGGANRLRERTGAQVWIHQAGVLAMTDLRNDPAIEINKKFGRYPDGFDLLPCKPDRTFSDGDSIPVGEIEVKVIHTAGHTIDSTCFLFEDNGRRGLLTGDVVFYGGKLGLLNLEGCSLSDYRRDIHKLANLGVDMLLPGHGVFVLRRGQNHIRRAIAKLSDFVLPESFFEDNEFVWDREYLRLMTG